MTPARIRPRQPDGRNNLTGLDEEVSAARTARDPSEETATWSNRHAGNTGDLFLGLVAAFLDGLIGGFEIGSLRLRLILDACGSGVVAQCHKKRKVVRSHVAQDSDSRSA